MMPRYHDRSPKVAGRPRRKGLKGQPLKRLFRTKPRTYNSEGEPMAATIAPTKWVEYFNYDMIVEHVLSDGGETTVCGEFIADMLVARPEDIERAAADDNDTFGVPCYECTTGEVFDLSRVTDWGGDGNVH